MSLANLGRPVAYRWRWPYTDDPFLWSYNDKPPPFHDPSSIVIEPLYATLPERGDVKAQTMEAALREIADTDQYPDSEDTASELREIARRALSQPAQEVMKGE
jgi:hypothetical protein